MLDFKDLEDLAQQAIEWTSTSVTSIQKRQYQDASLEEIWDLLEGVRESFALLASKLPPRLQKSARQEIEFFTALYQQRLMQSKSIQSSKGSIQKDSCAINIGSKKSR